MGGVEGGSKRPTRNRATTGEEQRVGESRGDLFDMVGDEDKRWGIGVTSHRIDGSEKVGAGDRVKTGTGLVEHEDLWFRSEGTGDEDALAFALGKDHPGALRKFG